MSDDIEIIAPSGAVDIVVGGVAQAGPGGSGGGGGGNVLRHGNGAPSDGLGTDGDFYINTANNEVHGPKAGGSWPAGTSLVGPAGADGTPGTNGAAGADGYSVLSGSGAPAGGTGNDGDFYINTDTWVIHGPKSTTWPAGNSLVGPAGADGSDGTPGTPGSDGADGADGRTVLNGDGAPSNGLGSDGDFYIDTTGNNIHGPKSSGTWPAGVSLVGPAGSNGTPGTPGNDGADGKTVLSGTGAPAGGLGSDGDFYIDTAANSIYGPKTGGTDWGSATSLVGPAGADGADGADGAPGGSEVTSDTIPTAADNTIKAFRKDLAGDHDTIAFMNGQGQIIIPEQHQIKVQKSAYVLSSHGGAPNAIGNHNRGKWGTETLINVTTQTSPGASGWDAIPRIEYSNSGSNNTQGAYYNKNRQFWRGRFGFFWSTTFGLKSGADDAQAIVFVGLSPVYNTTHSGGQPPFGGHSTWYNAVGLYKQGAHTNFHFGCSDSAGGTTLLDLGANFPANTNEADIYRVSIFCEPGVDDIHYQVERLGTAHVVTGKLTANLPDNQEPMNNHLFFGTGNPGASITGCKFALYGESYFLE